MTTSREAMTADATAAIGTTSTEYPIEFTGSGSEYFRIWIVNLLLTVVSIGIYSPWAKVRRLQYFYRNTRLADSVFDYHGSPIALLKGRLIALVLVGAYVAIGYVSITLALIILCGLAAALPWLIHRSFRFKLFQSSYRGLRFRFNGDLGGAYRVVLIPLLMVGAPVALAGLLGKRDGLEDAGALVVGVLGLVALIGYALLPKFHHAFKRYQHGHGALGTTGAAFDARVHAFYSIYLKTAGIGVLVVALLLATVGVGLVYVVGVRDVREDNTGSRFMQLLMVGSVLLLVAFYFALQFVLAFFNARLQNEVWSHTRLGETTFSSTVAARTLAFLYMKNLLLILLTVGLYTPFAVINTLRYRLQAVSAITVSDIDSFIADARPGENSTTGEGAVDLFDIDIAL